jgi:hypothetical protein
MTIPALDDDAELDALAERVRSIPDPAERYRTIQRLQRLSNTVLVDLKTEVFEDLVVNTGCVATAARLLGCSPTYVSKILRRV